MGRADRLLRSKIRTRYLVSTADGEAFAGVLVDHDEQHLVFADVEQVALNADRLHVDGQLWLPRDRIKYMQTITP
jgi:hypothetical protein